MARAKQLLLALLQDAASSVSGPLSGALSAAAAAEPAPVGAVQLPSWPGAAAAAAAPPGGLGRAASGQQWLAPARTLTTVLSGQLLQELPFEAGGAPTVLAVLILPCWWSQCMRGQVKLALPIARRRRGHDSGPLRPQAPGTLAPHTPQTTHTPLSGFRDRVPAIREAFDAQLLDALRAALQLMESPADAGAALGPGAPGGVASPLARYGSAAAPLGRGLSLAAAGGPAPDAERAAALRPYLQEQCLEAVMGLAADLEQRLAALPAPAPGAAGAPTVEQALLVGRLCSALAGGSEALPVLLGPPATWTAAAGGGAAAGAGRPSARPDAAAVAAAATAADAGGPLGRVAARLSGIAAAAYASWARWAAACIAADVAAAYAADSALMSASAPLSWVDTVVAVGGGGGTDGGYGLAADGGALEEDMRFPLPAAPSTAMLSALMAACWVRCSGRWG
jgi:hypothetical protein